MIDDDPKIARVIERALAVEHDVVTLISAAEALALIDAGEWFDAILCDLLLPGVDGVAFHDHLRASAPALIERLIIMTGGAFTPRTREFLARSSIPRLEKPFPLDELRRSVRRHVGGGR